MDSDSDNLESLEGDVDETTKETSNWGKKKYDYYYTDYIDNDYPSKLSAKEERLAAIEQEEALRIQKKLLSTLDNVDLHRVIDDSDDGSHDQENLIDFIENQNKLILQSYENSSTEAKKKKAVRFSEDPGSDECEFDDGSSDEASNAEEHQPQDGGRKRRPINMAIKKNRGLTPYKKKEYRNPRVKHKLKFKKAMSKRRRVVKEAQSEYHRYSGETTGIKTSTIKSIKLC